VSVARLPRGEELGPLRHVDDPRDDALGGDRDPERTEPERPLVGERELDAIGDRRRVDEDRAEAAVDRIGGDVLREHLEMRAAAVDVFRVLRRAAGRVLRASAGGVAQIIRPLASTVRG
jgi:hypothetical protein